MNQDFIQCLSDDVHVRADIAANLIYEYRDSKDPKFLKFAASSVYQMAHRVLMMYGLARDNQEYFILNFDQMAERVSNDCEDGVFLRQTDVSVWNGLSDCKPSDKSWDEFYDQLLAYAKKVQYFLTMKLSPKLILILTMSFTAQGHGDEFQISTKRNRDCY